MKPRHGKAGDEAEGGLAVAAGPAGSGRASAEASGPSFEEIAQRAHEIYLARGAGEGSADEDWLRAEQELRQAKRAGRQGDRSG